MEDVLLEDDVDLDVELALLDFDDVDALAVLLPFFFFECYVATAGAAAGSLIVSPLLLSSSYASIMPLS